MGLSTVITLVPVFILVILVPVCIVAVPSFAAEITSPTERFATVFKVIVVAFVVKELIENAIDAKATEIIVMIRDGGKSEIIVADNGEGIFKKELELSVKRHATSKLLENDLNNINELMTVHFLPARLPRFGMLVNLAIWAFCKS